MKLKIGQWVLFRSRGKSVNSTHYTWSWGQIVFLNKLGDITIRDRNWSIVSTLSDLVVRPMKSTRLVDEEIFNLKVSINDYIHRKTMEIRHLHMLRNKLLRGEQYYKR